MHDWIFHTSADLSKILSPSLCPQVEMHALKTVSAPLAALIYTAEPLWGALFAWVLLDERWGPTGWVGATLIVASTAASQLVNSRSKPKDA